MLSNFKGSMDKTAKLWTAPDVKLLGVFRGHKRGVWDVQFSPVDQVVATASADASIYIWSIADFSCVKVIITQLEDLIVRITFCSVAT